MHTFSGAKPADVVALAWYGLGFRPRHDLVLMAMHGKVAGRGPLLRMPLPTHRAGPAVPLTFSGSAWIFFWISRPKPSK